MLLFGIGSSLVRSSKVRPDAARETVAPAPGATSGATAWPALVDESLTNLNLAERREMIERLTLVGNDWSREILRAATAEETDAGLRAALERAFAGAPETHPTVFS